MNVLIIGSGGREHALAWKCAHSPRVQQVFVAPGNGGTARETKTQNVDIAVDDIAGLLKFARARRIDLTIVGPEVPLVLGVVDAFRADNLRCYGPTRAAAQLEGSKAFAKEFLARKNIPTARYRSFTELAAARAYVATHPFPLVIKADGLAAGKGVVIVDDVAQAEATLGDMLSGNAFGAAGARVVVEEFLQGEEASFIAMVDGEHILPLATSQDHKRLLDQDAGPNTGGMGAYSPAPVVTPEIHTRIMREVMEPTVRGMRDDGIPYTGFLYAGVMINAAGVPNVLEFNCRFGDPETQPIMLRLRSDLIDLVEAALNGGLDRVQAQWDPRAALGVVMAARGYPGTYPKGDVIAGIVPETADTKVFVAGAQLRNGELITDGGRVLCVTALGDTVYAAQQRAYATAQNITWPGAQYRRDIGFRAIARERA